MSEMENWKKQNAAGLQFDIVIIKAYDNEMKEKWYSDGLPAFQTESRIRKSILDDADSVCAHT